MKIEKGQVWVDPLMIRYVIISTGMFGLPTETLNIPCVTFKAEVSCNTFCVEEAMFLQHFKLLEAKPTSPIKFSHKRIAYFTLPGGLTIRPEAGQSFEYRVSKYAGDVSWIVVKDFGKEVGRYVANNVTYIRWEDPQ